MKNGWKEGKGSTHGVSGEEDGMALFPSSPHLHWGLTTIIGLLCILDHRHPWLSTALSSCLCISFFIDPCSSSPELLMILLAVSLTSSGLAFSRDQPSYS